ncbi:MAG: hypothetical protein L0216_15140 [Planctomycetales bacterium]|nr:hypothetical protein [Planctomycetales bacterium]
MAGDKPDPLDQPVGPAPDPAAPDLPKRSDSPDKRSTTARLGKNMANVIRKIRESTELAKANPGPAPAAGADPPGPGAAPSPTPAATTAGVATPPSPLQAPRSPPRADPAKLPAPPATKPGPTPAAAAKPEPGSGITKGVPKPPAPAGGLPSWSQKKTGGTAKLAAGILRMAKKATTGQVVPPAQKSEPGSGVTRGVRKAPAPGPEQARSAPPSWPVAFVRVLTAPEKFFRNLPESGGALSALVFALLAWTVAGLAVLLVLAPLAPSLLGLQHTPKTQLDDPAKLVAGLLRVGGVNALLSFVVLAGAGRAFGGGSSLAQAIRGAGFAAAPAPLLAIPFVGWVLAPLLYLRAAFAVLLEVHQLPWALSLVLGALAAGGAVAVVQVQGLVALV